MYSNARWLILDLRMAAADIRNFPCLQLIFYRVVDSHRVDL